MSAQPQAVPTVKPDSEHDDELDELLDSALDDFDKPKGKKKEDVTAPQKMGGELPQSAEEELARIFESAGVAETDQELEGLKDELSKLAQMAGKYRESVKQQQPGGVDNVLRETLKGLSEGSSQLSEQPTEAELHKMFENLGLQDGISNQDVGNLLPMMEGMMQSLLSKDLLYPAMKDIADKYPDWLADNRANLTTADFDKYNKQCELTRKVCFLFEEERETDGEAVKKQRFEQVMVLMQEMQALGHPPKELVGDAAPVDGLQFDAQGNPILPGTDQCVIS